MGHPFALYLYPACLLVVGHASKSTSKVQHQYRETYTVSLLVCNWYLWTRACHMGSMETITLRQGLEERD